MADDTDPILTDPPTPEVATHVRDYTRFVKLLTWLAVISLITAFLVMFIIA